MKLTEKQVTARSHRGDKTEMLYLAVELFLWRYLCSANTVGPLSTGVVAREKSTIALGQSLVRCFERNREATKRDVETVARTYAPHSGAVSSHERLVRATLIVVYKGDSLILRTPLTAPNNLTQIIVYDKYMLAKIIATVTLLSLAILSALFQVTSPSSVHPLVILVVFILIYLVALGALTFFLHSIQSIITSIGYSGTRVSLRRSYYFASVLALAPVILLAMWSIGKRDIYGILLVALFEAVACFYLAKHR